jgi:hypothetical protein
MTSVKNPQLFRFSAMLLRNDPNFGDDSAFAAFGKTNALWVTEPNRDMTFRKISLFGCADHDGQQSVDLNDVATLDHDFLPNVKDEPRLQMARSVRQHDS